MADTEISDAALDEIERKLINWYGEQRDIIAALVAALRSERTQTAEIAREAVGQAAIVADLRERLDAAYASNRTALAELERERTQNRELVAALSDFISDDMEEHRDCFNFCLCGRPLPCAIEQARGLVARAALSTTGGPADGRGKQGQPVASVDGIGSHAHHSIITPECRENRGDDGAFDEAVERAREVYDGIVQGWRSSGPQPTLHLVLGLERPTRLTGGIEDERVRFATLRMRTLGERPSQRTERAGRW